MFFAGEAYRVLGSSRAAERSYRIALASADDGALRSLIRDRLDGGSSYAVQVGAFASLANAQRASDAAARRADAMRLPPPRVERTTDATGRTLYVVRVGTYGSEEEAERARVRMGGGALVVRLETGG